MKFLGFTTHENGKPLLIREDLVGGWQFHRGHGLLLVLGQDMTDIEIKEGPEEFLAIVDDISLTIKDGDGNISSKGGEPCHCRGKQRRKANCPTDRLRRSNSTAGGTPCAEDVTTRTSSSTGITAAKASESATSGEQTSSRSSDGPWGTDGKKDSLSTGSTVQKGMSRPTAVGSPSQNSNGTDNRSTSPSPSMESLG